MYPIGFSTGALLRGDFRGALALLRAASVSAVELSALRLHEFAPLIDALCSGALADALAPFEYISLHAPGSYPVEAEADLVQGLSALVRARPVPIIVHPDTIVDPHRWVALGSHLLIENMDCRKRAGKTAAELCELFALLPAAGLCFDIGHARQIDPSMTEARAILRQHGHRLRQLHMSDVSLDENSKHRRLDDAAIAAFRTVISCLPSDPRASSTHLGAPVIILETPLSPVKGKELPASLLVEGILNEIEKARAALCP